MVNRNESILFYNMNSEKGRKIKLVCMKMGIRIKVVAKESYLEPIGFLAGVKEIASNGKRYEGEGFSDEMLVLKGLEDYRLDEFLRSTRKAGAGIVQLKAIVTEHNQEWDSLGLYEELKKENERLNPEHLKEAVSLESGKEAE